MRLVLKVGDLNGLVVGSGGAPGGLAAASIGYGGGDRYGGNFAGPPYPDGVQAPPRMYSDYGLDFPYAASTPWSSIVAYDLNTGKIKWQEALGEDRGRRKGRRQKYRHRGRRRAPRDYRHLHRPAVRQLQRRKLRAFDAENGKVLWSIDMPTGSEGIPAMYRWMGVNIWWSTRRRRSSSGVRRAIRRPLRPHSGVT